MSDVQDLYRNYLKVLRRRKTLLAFPVLLCLMGGAVLLKVLPHTYRATTLVVLEPSRAPSQIPGGSNSNLSDSLRTLIPQIQSSFYINLAMDRAGIPALPGEKREAQISRVARWVRAELTGKDSFQIVVTGPERNQVRNLTDALANVFIEQTTLQQVEFAERNANLLEKDLAEKETEIQEKGREISALKQKFSGSLPDQTATIATRQSALTTQLDVAEQRLRVAKDNLATVESRVAEARKSQGGEAVGDTRLELEAEQRKLSDLLTRFTEKYPEVIACRNRIRRLEARLAEDPGGGAAPKIDAGLDPKLQADYQNARQEVVRQEAQIRTLSARIEDLENKLNRVPNVQAQLDDLQREYQALQETFSTRKKTLENARSWVGFEKANQGDRFAILEPARLPSRPYSPDPLMLLPLALMVSLGLGVASVVVAEIFSTSFQTTRELTEAAGVLILGEIGKITTRADQLRLRLALTLWWLAFVVVALTLAWAVGT